MKNVPEIIVVMPDLVSELPPRNCPGCNSEIENALCNFNPAHNKLEDISKYFLYIKAGSKYESRAIANAKSNSKMQSLLDNDKTLDEVYAVISDVVDGKYVVGESVPRIAIEVRYECGAMYRGEKVPEWNPNDPIVFHSGCLDEFGNCMNPSIEKLEEIIAAMKENK